MAGKCKVIRSLLDIPAGEPETRRLWLPRLELEVTLREISYKKLMRCRKEREANLHYLLESAQTPNVRDPAWYHDHMGCPTPVEALAKLLRPGEIEQLCKAADHLNGYGGGSVISMEEDTGQLQYQAISAALEDLEKN